MRKSNLRQHRHDRQHGHNKKAKARNSYCLGQSSLIGFSSAYLMIWLSIVIRWNGNVSAFLPPLSCVLKIEWHKVVTCSNRRPVSVASHVEKELGERELKNGGISSGSLVKDADRRMDSQGVNKQERENNVRSLTSIIEEASSFNGRNNRRMFVSSVLASTSVAMGYSNKELASAQELTWAASPVNKRSGVTVFEAEKKGYNVRFVTYLSRFLISFDEECQRWWYTRAADIPRFATIEQVDLQRLKQFGSFSASVEVGLQEFEGTDGSRRLMTELLRRYCPDMDELQRIYKEKGISLKPSDLQQKETVIKEARRQIALLFGLLESNQPVEEITRTLAAVDDARVTKVTVLNPGRGYAPGYDPPNVTFPKPLGASVEGTAQGTAVLTPSGRLLRIDVGKRGIGYLKPPSVTVSDPVALAYGSPTAKAATAKAYLFEKGANKGRIARIQLLTPGEGYNEDEPIQVVLSPPDIASTEGGETALASAVLEYQVAAINITYTGNGYAAEKPLEILVDPPPLSAKINRLDPMMGDFLIAEAMAMNATGSSSSSTDIVLNTKTPDVYDPSWLGSKAFNTVKKCVGNGCSDIEPVVAVASAKSQSDSYTSYTTYEQALKRQEVESALKKRSAATLRPYASVANRKNGVGMGGANPEVIAAATGENEALLLPFWTGGSVSSSRQLLTLLPSGIGLSYNTEKHRYELTVGKDLDILNFDESLRYQGKPINPDFGPRGRSPIEREKDLDSSSFLRFILSGAICSSIAHLTLTPLDVIKTKVQTDPNVYTDFFTSFQILVKEMGLSGFFTGWAPTFVGFFINGGIAYSGTEFFRRYYANILGSAAGGLEVPLILASASTAAFFGAFLLSPTEAVRIRTVADPTYGSNMITVTKRMVAEEGMQSLFRAVPLFLLKDIPFAMAKFAVFDLSTAYMYDQFPAATEDLRLSLLVSLIGGTLGGMVAAIVSNPADATISEMKKSKSDMGPLGTIQLLLERDGTVGLLRGLDVRLFFYSLLVSLQFLLYDAVRFSLGIGSDDMKLFLDVLGGALRESGGPI